MFAIIAAFFVMYNIYMEIKAPGMMFMGFVLTAATTLTLIHPSVPDYLTNTAGVVALLLVLLAAFCHCGRAFNISNNAH